MTICVRRYLYLVTLLTHNLATCMTIDDGDNDSRRTFPFRRAIDGTRGRKFYDPETDGFPFFQGSSGRYDPDHHANDFTDIRNNVPGEPGVDYPSYTRLPQTGFACQPDFRGYYADEAAGCQVFHVCDGTFLVSSFLCPVGSVFSQKLLTCDWWTKVDCSSTRNYHAKNIETHVSEVDDDEILRKAFEMSSVRSADERIPTDTFVPDSSADFVKNADRADFPSRSVSRSHVRPTDASRQRHRDDYHDGRYNDDDDNDRIGDSSIRIHTIGRDRNDDRRPIDDFQPSYAPTVPTVITTSRRFYSPTFPTTYKPSTDRDLRGRYDLELESSDHLYTAKGRTIGNVRTVTPASRFDVPTDFSDGSSLARLVNSAHERNEEIENMEESESTNYRTTIMPSIVSIDDTKRRFDDVRVADNFAIRTIDDVNADPNRFVYDREEKTRSDDETRVESSSALSDKNFTRDFNFKNREKNKKISALLQPPRDDVKQFRITVLDESSESKNHRKPYKSKGLRDNDSNPDVKSVRRFEIPDLDGEGRVGESRVIRVFANDYNSNSDFSGTIGIDSSINKIGKNNFDLETETISKVDVEEPTITMANENKNLENDTETLLPTENFHRSIDAVDEVGAVDESRLNGTTERSVELILLIDEDKKNEDHEKSAEKSVTVKTNTSTAENGSNDEELSSTNDNSSDKTIFPQEKNTDYSIGSEKILLNAQTAFSNEKIGDEDATTIDDVASLSNEKITNFETNNTDRYDRSTTDDRFETHEKIGDDSVVEGSSPFEVTLTLNKDEELDPNGEIIRELIAKQEIGDSILRDDYKGFDIVKSNVPEASRDRPEDFITDLDNTKIGKKILSKPETDEKMISNNSYKIGQSANDYRSLARLINGPNLSRPFALRSVEKSATSSEYPIDDGETISKQSKKTFSERRSKSKKESLTFELPDRERSVNFISDHGRENVRRIDDRHDANGENEESTTTMPKIGKNSFVKTIVETEFVPSLSFSLNTDEERQEYMQAVIDGRLPDVRANESTIKYASNTSTIVEATD